MPPMPPLANRVAPVRVPLAVDDPGEIEVQVDGDVAARLEVLLPSRLTTRLLVLSVGAALAASSVVVA